MHVVISGSSGLVGTALAASLLADGHRVTRLVRREPRSVTADGSVELRWDARPGGLAPAALEGVDAVVGLAGAGVGDHRWTEAYRRTIRDSRVDSTAALAQALAACANRPQVFVSASAIGWYGPTGEQVVDESDPAGAGFLAGVCVDWEAAAGAAVEAGVRVVHPRFGIVAAQRGGAFGRVLPLARLGLGGPLGGGRQYWSLVSLADAIGALRYALVNEELSGPLNITGPEAVRNRDVARLLGRVLHRPAMLPAPAPALKLLLGEFAGDVLMSQRVRPAGLLGAGYQFAHPTAEAIVRYAAGK